MKNLRSRGVRRYGASRPPRGVRAEVLVRSPYGSWDLRPSDTACTPRRSQSARPAADSGAEADSTRRP